MPLKAWIGKLEEVEEADRKHYRAMENGEGFVAAVDPIGGWALENVASLRKTLATERRRKTEAEGKLAAFKDRKPEDFDVLSVELESLRKANPNEKAAAEIERVKKELSEKGARELTAKDAKIGELSRLIERQMVDTEATGAISRFKGDVALLLPHVRAGLRAVPKDDGRWRTQVVDESGNERISNKANSTDAMSVAEFVESLKERFPGAFESPQKPGLGVGTPGGGTSSGNGVVKISREEMHDPRKYQAAKATAEKAGGRIEVTE